MVKALAITTIHRRVDGKDEVIPASTAKKVSVFNADKTELADLAKLGGARAATQEEIALFKAQANAEGNGDGSDDADDDDGTDQPPKSPNPPSSGAPNDPKASPKASGKKANQDDDLGV